MVVMEAGLQSQDKGPVLDPEWPTILRTEVNDSICVMYVFEVWSEKVYSPVYIFLCSHL